MFKTRLRQTTLHATEREKRQTSKFVLDIAKSGTENENDREDMQERKRERERETERKTERERQIAKDREAREQMNSMLSYG